MRSRVLPAALGAPLLVALIASPAAATGETPSAPVGGDRLATTGAVVDAPGAMPLPRVKAATWVLADLETGEVLAAKDPHGRQRPASTLKILTALTVLPRLDPAASYVARWEDANAEGSRVGLVPDATYSMHNLFEALMLVSGNDAATALANAAGGVGSTVEAMNRTARELGALDTSVRNPSGLDAPGQYSSAYDLALITRAAMARDDFRGYVSTVKSQFPGKMPRGGKARKSYEIYTQDRLLLNYRGAIGVKTGWTTKARGTFVGVATRGGRTLVATVMHTDFDAWREAAALLTWGFRNAGSVTPVGSLDPVAAAAEGAPEAAGPIVTRPAVTAGASDEGGGRPWWVDVPLVLLGVVLALRARVLVLRRVRRSRSGVGGNRVPQPRDLRRVATAATAAPSPAPMAAPRHRDPREDLADEPDTSTASAGTAS
ncbi:MAG: D-alanyl-D-alanine carboxypeptidase family protein [Actinomycetes bacterium]